MAEELDMEQRDPNELNFHVKVGLYEDVFGEPEGIRSADGVWRCSYKCFTKTLGLCYLITTYLCAVPLAFCWACNFACVAFCHIWVVTPCLRDLNIRCIQIQKVVKLQLSVYVPVYEACGHCFSQVKVSGGGAKAPMPKPKVVVEAPSEDSKPLLQDVDDAEEAAENEPTKDAEENKEEAQQEEKQEEAETKEESEKKED